MDEPDQVSKRPTPSLTITIPPHEEEIRGMSSPESYSPLPSSAHTSGGNSPQQRKIHRELLTSKGFKRQVNITSSFYSLLHSNDIRIANYRKVGNKVKFRTRVNKKDYILKLYFKSHNGFTYRKLFKK